MSKEENLMKKFLVQVVNEVGLHARPAAIFVQAASKFKSTIKIRNFTSGNDFVNAKSILSVLTQGVEKDHCIELEIEGEDEIQAVDWLRILIETDFQQ